MNTIYYIAYGLFNLLYVSFSAWVLLFATTYLNDSLIPNSLRWKKSGELRTDLLAFNSLHITIASLEALLLLCFLYLVDKRYLTAIVKITSGGKIAFWTVLPLYVFLLIFIFLMIFN